MNSTAARTHDEDRMRTALVEMMAAGAVLDFGGFPFELPRIDDIRAEVSPQPLDQGAKRCSSS
jgi:hypothetical protein